MFSVCKRHISGVCKGFCKCITPNPFYRAHVPSVYINCAYHIFYIISQNNTQLNVHPFDIDLPDQLPSLTPAPPKKSRFKASRVTFEDEDAEERLDSHDTHISAVLSRIVVCSVL